MNILVIHPSFPGQFLHLAPHLAQDKRNRVVFLAKENAIDATLKDVELGIYNAPNEKAQKWADASGPLSPAAEAVLDGQQIVRSLRWLKREQDFEPDVVIGHAGWGSTLYVKDMYPKTPVLGYFEWYYHAERSDCYWFPDEIAPMEKRVSIRTRNAHHLLALEAADAGVTPTRWQYEQFPKEFRPKLSIIHDGVDTEFMTMERKRGLTLDDGSLDIGEEAEIVTYVARGLEMYRGFPYFMDAVRELLARRPKCHAVIVGADRICYGPQIVGTSYRAEEEKKGGYDESRVHFVGLRTRGEYRKILQASDVHIYLTRPFVLSWSALEAMSCGCAIVGSDTPPVREVMEDGVNGLIADFRSPHHIARRAEELLDDRALAARLGKAARETVLERYELKKCLGQMEDLLHHLVNR